MRYIADHDFHIHSGLSLCSGDTEQNPQTILEHARKNGLKKICLTDHFWDDTALPPPDGPFYTTQNMAYIRQALPLPQCEGVQFCFGAETEMDKACRVAMADETYDVFDFVIIPTTHLHMTGVTIDPDVTDYGRRAKIWEDRLDALLQMELPWHKIGIAHLTDKLIYAGEHIHHLKMLDQISQSRMETLFARAAALGVGIELNFLLSDYTDGELETVLRPYRIAKTAGCKFYLGSDAHHPAELAAAPENFQGIIEQLALTEEDKLPLLR